MEAYAADARFYLALAAIALAVQAILAYALGNAQNAALYLAGANIVVDAFLSGCVSVGVAARMAESERPWRAIVVWVARRGWAIVFVDVVTWLVHELTYDLIFGDAATTGYYLLVLPTLVLWGSLLFADVIASIDETTPAPALPGLSLLQSIALSWRGRNLWRVTLLAAVTIPAMMVPMLLDDLMKAHGFPMHGFWSSIPFDAIVVGPYQALFTVVYLNARRVSSGSRPG